MQSDDLNLLRLKLKSGEYDGADVMRAWIAIEELVRARRVLAEALADYDSPATLSTGDLGCSWIDEARALVDSISLSGIDFDLRACRASFEAHMSKLGWAVSDLQDLCAQDSARQGEYRHQGVQDAWELWQAAQQALAASRRS